MYFRLVLFAFTVCCVSLFQLQACSDLADCDDAKDQASAQLLDPANSPCTQNCECNNQRYRGVCQKVDGQAQGVCVSFAREECKAKGAQKICVIEQPFGGTCRTGISTCQPDYLKAMYWGDCEPNCTDCKEGDVRACYTGPEGTSKMGVCRAGEKKCDAQGRWGTCQSQIVPSKEVCNQKDDDCNGQVDDNCETSESTQEQKVEPTQEPVVDDAVDAGAERQPESRVETSPEPTTPEVAVEKTPDVTCSGCVFVSTIAGSVFGYKDGQGTLAKFNAPHNLIADTSGNIYISDTNNHVIRKMTLQGNVATLAGGGVPGMKDDLGSKAWFYEPQGLALNGNGSLFVADTKNNRIREVNLSSQMVSTFAGSGASTGALVEGPVSASKTAIIAPTGLAYDTQDDRLYVTQQSKHAVRLVKSGQITTLIGMKGRGFIDGSLADALCSGPMGILLNGKDLYFADSQNSKIRLVDTTSTVSTFAGSGGIGYIDGTSLQAEFRSPRGIASDGNGNMYVADTGNHCIRKISNGNVTTFAGKCGTPGDVDGKADDARFRSPNDLIYVKGTGLFVADTGNHRIRLITLP